MKTVFTTLLLLLTTISYAQVRLGSSEKEIREEFTSSNYNLESGNTNDGIYYVAIETDDATVVYYFDEEKVCNFSILIPNNQGALNTYAERYNNQYVIVSDTEWKMYSDGGVAKIKLMIEDDGSYFAWSN